MTPYAAKMLALFRKYRPIAALAIIALLAELGYATVNQSAIPPYIDKELRLGTSWLGWIMAAFLLVETVFRPGFGALGDRIGRKPLLVAGPLASCVSALLIARATDPAVIVSLRVLDGLGAAAIWPTAFALVGDSVEEHNRSVAMSVLNVTYMIGIALGPLLGGLVSEYTLPRSYDNGYRHYLPLMGSVVNDYPGSQRYVFYTVGLIFAVTALIALVALRKPPPHRQETHAEEPAPYHISDLLYSLRAIPHMLIMVFLAFCAIGLLIPVVKLYAMDVLKLTETQFGQLLLPVAGILALCALPLGRLGDKWGKTEAVRLGVSITAIAMWMIVSFRSTLALILAGSLLGIGFLIAMPAWLALISNMTSSANRGQVLGAVGMAQGFGAILGVVTAGHLYEGAVRFPSIHRHLAPMVASAALLTLSAVLTFAFLKGKEPARGNSK